MKDKKGKTLWFVVKMGDRVLFEFIPTSNTQIKDMGAAEAVLNKMTGRTDFHVDADWKKKDGLFKATWDDREGFVMHAYGETRELAKERMIELFVPQCEDEAHARAMVEKDVDDMYSVLQVEARDEAEG